jgi:hypothetical protein
LGSCFVLPSNEFGFDLKRILSKCREDCPGHQHWHQLHPQPEISVRDEVSQLENDQQDNQQGQQVTLRTTQAALDLPPVIDVVIRAPLSLPDPPEFVKVLDFLPASLTSSQMRLDGYL